MASFKSVFIFYPKTGTHVIRELCPVQTDCGFLLPEGYWHARGGRQTAQSTKNVCSLDILTYFQFAIHLVRKD